MTERPGAGRDTRGGDIPFPPLGGVEEVTG